MTVTLIVEPLPVSPSLYNKAIDGRPFHPSVYGQSIGIMWFAIVAPSMSGFEKQTVTNMNSFSNQVNTIATMPGVQ